MEWFAFITFIGKVWFLLSFFVYVSPPYLPDQTVKRYQRGTCAQIKQQGHRAVAIVVSGH